MAMQVRVECYSGYKANERPVRFYLGDVCHEVREVEDCWYGEDYEYFKLRTADGSRYILKYDRNEDTWELTQYTAPEALSDNNPGTL